MASPDERVVHIVESLEAACSVIEAELEVINVDLAHAEDACRRYGEVFLAPCRYLTQLRENKKMRFREILGELEALKVQVESSQQLLAVLEHGGSSRPAVAVVSSMYGAKGARRL